MATTPSLLPQPRAVEYSGGAFALPEKRLIVLDGPEPQALRAAGSVVQSTLRLVAGLEWEIVAGTAIPTAQAGVTISVVPRGVAHPQGYELTVTLGGGAHRRRRPGGRVRRRADPGADDPGGSQRRARRERAPGARARLARLRHARRDARREPRPRADDGDAVSPD